jgi:hypothetical protein
MSGTAQGNEQDHEGRVPTKQPASESIANCTTRNCAQHAEEYLQCSYATRDVCRLEAFFIQQPQLQESKTGKQRVDRDEPQHRVHDDGRCPQINPRSPKLLCHLKAAMLGNSRSPLIPDEEHGNRQQNSDQAKQVEASPPADDRTAGAGDDEGVTNAKREPHEEDPGCCRACASYQDGHRKNTSPTVPIGESAGHDRHGAAAQHPHCARQEANCVLLIDSSEII